jgi:hypothetical protein
MEGCAGTVWDRAAKQCIVRWVDPPRPSDPQRLARLGIASRPPNTAPTKFVALGWLGSTLFGALFPRLRHQIAWVARAGPRGIAAYLALHAGGLLLVDSMIRFVARQGIEREEVEARLREQLGRPPSQDEIRAAWLKHKGLDPTQFPLR